MSQQNAAAPSSSGCTKPKRPWAQFLSDADSEPIHDWTLSSSTVPDLEPKKDLQLPLPRLLPGSSFYGDPNPVLSQRVVDKSIFPERDSVPMRDPWDQGYQERSSVWFDSTNIQSQLEASHTPAAQFRDGSTAIAIPNQIPFWTQGGGSSSNSLSTSNGFSADIQHCNQISPYPMQFDAFANQRPLVTAPMPTSFESVGADLEGPTETFGVNNAINSTEAPVPEPGDSSYGEVETDGSFAAVVEAEADPGSSPPYNMCFGMFQLEALPSGMAKATEGQKRTVVTLRNSAGLFKLYSKDSSEYAGLLESTTLESLLLKFQVTLSSTVVSQATTSEQKSCHKPQTGTIEIIIYGFKVDADAIGDFLGEHDIYLQHPSSCDQDIPYVNPQFLIPPGGSMPNLQTLSLTTETKQAGTTDVMEEREKIEVLQIFNQTDGPTIYKEVSQSPFLRTNLKEHQKKALAMMVEKEQGILEGAQFGTLWDFGQDGNGQMTYRHIVTGETLTRRPNPVYGGILADEMGLGKTICVIALITWCLDAIDHPSIPDKSTPRATLVIAPKSTLMGWQQQLDRHLHPGRLQIAIYHGSRRDRLAEHLHSHDVVLTTYDTLRSDWDIDQGDSPLFSQEWVRVVLDEAHRIRNRDTKVFQAAHGLHARRRWVLTGTPIQNSLDDYGVLLTFLRAHPFVSKQSFRHWIVDALNNSHDLGIRRLRRLVKATCLRRTKKVLGGQLSLLPRRDRVEKVGLSHHERKLYQFFEAGHSNMLAGVFSEPESALKGAKSHNVVVLINFLRRICDHGEQLLPPRASTAWQNKDSIVIDWAALQDQYQPALGLCSPEAEQDLDCLEFEEQATDMSLNALTPKSGSFDGADLNVQRSLGRNKVMTPELHPPTPPVDKAAFRYQPSSKVAALLRNLRREQAEYQESGIPVKSVVFSIWTGMLNLIETALKLNQFTFQRVDGQKSLQRRMAALSTFQNDPTCTILLASVGSIAEGVDLTAASRVHLVEPHWNPMVEEQALNRVHRIGQDRTVVTIRYIVENSIEEYLQRVQNRKLELIHQSLSEISIAE